MTVLYSTGCPKCKILEKQLRQHNIEFNIITDKNLMIEKGFKSAPKLEIDNKILDYPDAIRWAMNGGQS